MCREHGIQLVCLGMLSLSKDSCSLSRAMQGSFAGSRGPTETMRVSVATMMGDGGLPAILRASFKGPFVANLGGKKGSVTNESKFPFSSNSLLFYQSYIEINMKVH